MFIVEKIIMGVHGERTPLMKTKNGEKILLYNFFISRK